MGRDALVPCVVWVFSARVSMPPGDWAVPARGGFVAYAWFVQQHGYRGRAEIGHLPVNNPRNHQG